jgi:2'-5' RNA ligase
MHYAVLLQFGTKDEEKLLEYWRWISQNGGNDNLFKSGLKPHITLSSFRSTDIEIFCEKLHEFAINTDKFQITLDSISTFDLNPDVIYLKPNIITDLQRIYKDFHSYFLDVVKNVNVNCLPNNWIPHSAIGIKIKREMTKPILDDLKKNFLPFDILIEKISIIENNIGKRYLAEFNLNNEKHSNCTN